MCFSTTASFASSAALLLISCVAIYRARTKNKQLMLAAIPLIFAIQQACEGLIWNALSSNQSATIYTYIYLSFVFIVWPLWIPIAIMRMNNVKNKLFFIPVAAGASVALLGIIMTMYTEPIASVIDNHIYYSFDLARSYCMAGTIAYLIATITPFFMSTVPSMTTMGIILAISYAVSYIFYYQFILSIWCFFAAILSMFILKIVW